MQNIGPFTGQQGKITMSRKKKKQERLKSVLAGLPENIALSNDIQFY